MIAVLVDDYFHLKLQMENPFDNACFIQRPREIKRIIKNTIQANIVICLSLVFTLELLKFNNFAFVLASILLLIIYLLFKLYKYSLFFDYTVPFARWFCHLF